MPHNKARALEPIEFIQLLNHTGDFKGQPFVLLDWQYQVLWDVYGAVDENSLRQYRYAYLEIPKKNGKTELTGAIAVYHLFCDGPEGEIYCCASDRLQAGKVYQAAKSMIMQNAELSVLCKIIDSQKIIINRQTGTFIHVLSSESNTKHGLNPTVVIFDELHAQPDRKLWDVMTFGAGAARKEPIWWIITTAGDDPDHKSIGWEQHEYARKIIDGSLVDPSWYAKIYAAPEDADIFDEKVWYACNPSLGHAIPIENVRREALTARNSTSVEKNFRWLRLNQWVSIKSTSLLPLPLWDKTAGPLTKADLIGKRCYAGLDLSFINDLTGIALLFPPQDGIEFPYEGTNADGAPAQVAKQGWYFVLYAFHPLENMKERIAKDHVSYDDWAKGGWLEVTPGDVIDYTYIEAKIVELNQAYDIVAWGNDPRGAEKLRQDLMNDHDIEMLEVAQDIKTLSEPIKEVERLSKLGEMRHEKNPLGRWTWGNVTVHVDGNGNYKPMKNKAVDRFDPMAALFDAMFLAIRMEQAGAPFLGVSLIG
jgi:phage terminase large subunit-like protein